MMGHEAILGRSAHEDRKSRRKRHVQVRGRSPLRRQSLLGQTLLKDRRSGRISPTKKRWWKAAEDRPGHGEATRGGRRGAPGSHYSPETPLLGACDGQGFERLHRRATAQEDGLQPKKRTVGALERDEWLRAAWRVTLAARIDPKRLVFVDEMGANTSLSALRARSRLGRRAYCSVPRNRGPNTTLLSSMTVEGMGPSLAVEDATDREVFEAYV
jgi:hypothetical protein